MTKNNEINEVNLASIFKDNYYEYGMNVIEDRALPDVRDGLKPVHRAIIYEMLNSRVTSDKRHSKVAKITGAVIGNWHPHGDMSVEEALAGLAVPWKNTLPVIDIAGNQGSVFGDPAAAGRYIEARLSPAGDAFGKKLREGIVPYVPNFDNTGKMPVVLPAQLPYLLLNGIADGIAVGVAAALPPHNAQEVMEMTLAYLKNPKIKLKELLEIMPGPDFPTGATIINKDELYKMYETGYGRIAVRAKMEYDKKTHSFSVKEIPYPYSGSMDNLVENIVMNTSERGRGQSKRPAKVRGVRRVEEFSGKDGIDINIQLEKGVDKDQVEQALYAHTRLETTEKFIFRALNNRELGMYSLRQYLLEYTNFQHEIVENEHVMEKRDLDRRIEILTGRIEASEAIDEIVDVVRNSNGKSEVKEVLMTGKILKGTLKKYFDVVSNFSFTELQAESIANIPLYQLNRLDHERISKERENQVKRLELVERVINDRDYRHKLIIKRLEEERKILTDTPRQTKIINDDRSRPADIKVPLKKMYIAMDRYGYIRIEDKNFENATETDNKSRVGFFDEEGNCWNMFMDQTKPTKDRGTLSEQIFDIKSGSRITGFVTGITDESDKEILFIYKDGRMKRSELSQFMTKTRSTKVNTRNEKHKLDSVIAIPSNANTVQIDGKNYPLDNIPLQTRAARGKMMLPAIKDGEKPLVIKFKESKTKVKAEQKEKKEELFDAVVVFDGSDSCQFDWDTTDTNLYKDEGIYVTTYQELIKTTLVFVHTDGSAKRVNGKEFEVKTRRTNLRANKKDLNSIYINEAKNNTLVGHYEGNFAKRIDETKISEQSKVGGGIRVFYSEKNKLQSVESVKDSPLDIVSFATQEKEK